MLVKKKFKENKLAVLVIFLVIIINLSFGFPRLSSYSSVDEPYWTYNRTPDFWKAILHRKWKNTNINDKPGITAAAISGLGLPWGNPLAYKSIRQEPKSLETTASIMKINFNLRIPIYLTALIFFILFYLLVKKIMGTKIALFSMILLGLSPIILGISLIINPDSLLWGFLPLSLLSYLAYLKEPPMPDWKKRKYLFLSGILLGLSLLTKYVANIGYIYILALIFLEYIFNHRTDFNSYIKKSLADFLIIVLVSCATFYLLYPACWRDPKVLLDGTIFSPAFKSTWPIFAALFGAMLADMFLLKSRIFGSILDVFAKYKKYLKFTIGALMLATIVYVFANVWSGLKFYDFVGEMASPKGGSHYNLIDFIQLTATDLYGLVFALTPIVLIFFIYSLILGAFWKKADPWKSHLILYFSLFILLYYLASTANFVTATIRYQIALFPLAYIMAAIGLAQFMQWKRIKIYARDWINYSLIIILSLISLFSIKPFYFTYASGLLPKNYVLNLKDMGDGSFEAAQFLNGLPNAQNLVIWSDKGAVCETFVGTCKVGFSKADTKDINFDYFVISTGRESRSLKMHTAGYFKENIDFAKLYSASDSGTYKIILGGRPDNFVKISSTQDLVKQ